MVTQAQIDRLDEKVDGIASDVAFIKGSLQNGIVRKATCDERHRGLILRVLGAIGLGGAVIGALAGLVFKFAF